MLSAAIVIGALRVNSKPIVIKGFVGKEETDSHNMSVAVKLANNMVVHPYQYILTLEAPITTAADDIHKCFIIVFQRK